MYRAIGCPSPRELGCRDVGGLPTCVCRVGIGDSVGLLDSEATSEGAGLGVVSAADSADVSGRS